MYLSKLIVTVTGYDITIAAPNSALNIIATSYWEGKI